MKAPSGVPADLVDKEVLGEAAYQHRLHEFCALNTREILTVNLDIPAAITKVRILTCTEPSILASETIALGKMLRDLMRVYRSSPDAR